MEAAGAGVAIPHKKNQATISLGTVAMVSRSNQVANSHNRPAHSACPRSKTGFAAARFRANAPGGCKFCTRVQNFELAGPEVGDSAP